MRRQPTQSKRTRSLAARVDRLAAGKAAAIAKRYPFVTLQYNAMGEKDWSLIDGTPLTPLQAGERVGKTPEDRVTIIVYDDGPTQPTPTPPTPRPAGYGRRMPL